MSVIQKYKKLKYKLERERKFKQDVEAKYEFALWVRKENRKLIHANHENSHNLLAEVKLVSSHIPNMLVRIKSSKQRIRSIQNEMSQLIK